MTTDTSMGSGALSMSEHPDIKDLTRQPDPVADATSYLHVLVLLAGAYAAISAWVVGFADQSSLAVTNLIVGAGVVLLTLTVLRERIGQLTAAYSLLGVWLIIAPWVVQDIHHSSAVIVSNVVVGAVIAAAGIVATTRRTFRLSRR